MNMRNMAGLAIVAMMLATGVANADISIETVIVGNSGNAADTTGYGAVAYTYNIGKYEVTTGQYTAFLNNVAKTDTYGLYNTFMADVGNGGCNIKRTGSSGNYAYSVASDWTNRPVNYVSWGDAARFSNWLHNGQPTGEQCLDTTEDGAYYLNGATSDTQLVAVSRKAGAKWAITSEDEWYKAAYHKGGSSNAGYWGYPTGSDTAPGRDMNDVSGNNANCFTVSGTYPIDSGTYYTTVVGEFQNSNSPYETFDQGGNVFEWNEAQDLTYGYRGLRGGAFYNIFNLTGYGSYAGDLHTAWRSVSYPTLEVDALGFRVAEVPEPASLTLLLLGGLALMKRKLTTTN